MVRLLLGRLEDGFIGRDESENHQPSCGQRPATPCPAARRSLTLQSFSELAFTTCRDATFYSLSERGWDEVPNVHSVGNSRVKGGSGGSASRK